MNVLLGFIAGIVAFVTGSFVGYRIHARRQWSSPEIAFVRRLRACAMLIRRGHAARYKMRENRPRLTLTVFPPLPCRRKSVGQFCGMPLEVEVPIDA